MDRESFELKKIRIETAKLQKDLLKTNLEILAGFFGVVTVFLGGREYFENKQGEQITRTITMLEKSYNDPLQQKLETLSDIWDVEYPKIKNSPEIIKAKAEKDGKTLEIQWNSKVAEVIESNKLKTATLAAYTYYRDIAICANSNVCDKEATTRFFGCEATKFLAINLGYLSARKLDTSDIMTFAGGCPNT